MPSEYDPAYVPEVTGTWLDSQSWPLNPDAREFKPLQLRHGLAFRPPAAAPVEEAHAVDMIVIQCLT